MDSRAKVNQCTDFCTLSDPDLISKRIDHKRVQMSELAMMVGVEGMQGA